MTCGILVSWPGIEPLPAAAEAQSLNHWTPRDVPLAFLTSTYARCLCLQSPFSPPVTWLMALNCEPNADTALLKSTGPGESSWFLSLTFKALLVLGLSFLSNVTAHARSKSLVSPHASLSLWWEMCCCFPVPRHMANLFSSFTTPGSAWVPQSCQVPMPSAPTGSGATLRSSVSQRVEPRALWGVNIVNGCPSLACELLKGTPFVAVLFVFSHGPVRSALQ